MNCFGEVTKPENQKKCFGELTKLKIKAFTKIFYGVVTNLGCNIENWGYDKS